MTSRSRLTRRAAVGGAVALLLAGCGGGRGEFDPGSPDEVGLSELGAMYRGFAKKNQRGPKSLKEIQGLEQGFPTAVQKLRSGELVLRWGAPLSAGNNAPAVLAYSKDTPQQGGSVLLQDGKTIKTMTAEEFKSAPKADGG